MTYPSKVKSAAPHGERTSPSTRQSGMAPARSAGNGGSGTDSGGVLESREPIRPIPDLNDPRLPIWSDRIVALRVFMIESKGGGAESAKVEALFSDESLDPLAGSVYRYTRAGDLTNDEMGYGERVTEPLWSTNGDKAEPRERISQRTKSGRQSLGKR